jgi:hypothetical protein
MAELSGFIFIFGKITNLKIEVNLKIIKNEITFVYTEVPWTSVYILFFTVHWHRPTLVGIPIYQSQEMFKFQVALVYHFQIK